MEKTIHYQGDPFTLSTISCRINEGFQTGEFVKVISIPMRRYFIWRIARVIDQRNGNGILDLVY
ncbi:hypothetical protein GM921_15065 [Pedobacter sp. LMG 31464]|uniref:Uncharacterized protein n=1 Tax=Pedobacter planticolens TaxID=2679964 RepID=A0A923DZA7_9SPHI|nr:hypothetical protein [Pedobacter planticolens]MBB2146822.1 hypothetical protein [Pedobacter planticolens]